ncbi:hypothetical protein MNBD_GAMMA09-3503 [hydrothermal vent metagenome]|uniref:Uncharacterized protein n=1 Tax=hydrothermal vent metagenome TaxID=652676 RepID=A0A3B0XT00_9ZZZZ
MRPGMILRNLIYALSYPLVLCVLKLMDNFFHLSEGKPEKLMKAQHSTLFFCLLINGRQKNEINF